jgi:ATP-dependent RNA helicase DeaD
MLLFEESGLSPELIKAVKEIGFNTATPIQEIVIPHILKEENDVLALAQTGTGKTAAFGLPVIQKVNTKIHLTQCIILSPTRELCVQISDDLKAYSKYVDNLKIATIYGGASAEKQIKELNKGSQIVVGTPGRVLDLIKRKKLQLKNIQYVILDEADEMLDMGFKDELDAILERTPEQKQTFLFSATMPKTVLKIAKKYMNDYVELTAGDKNIGAKNVNHHYYLSKAKDKYKVLKRILDVHPKIYAIVFCRTRRDTKEIADKLIENSYNAEALHGDLSQMQREYVMNRFKTKHLQVLVATDVAARGLDVTDLSHVIHYNLPDESKTYIHRSGRTGRAGKSGTSISLIHGREFKRILEFEKATGKKIEKQLIPSGKDICEKQLFNLIDKVEKVEVDKEQIEAFTEVIYKKLSWLSREQLIDHFVSVEFNRFLAYYKGAPDLNVYEEKEQTDYSVKTSKRRKDGWSRFFINIGSGKKLSSSKLIGLINDRTRNRDIKIGKIEILKNFSFFEIESSYEEDILRVFEGSKYKGMNISVELSKEKRKKRGKRKK